MGDIFDYIGFFLAALFLAVLKITGYMQWDWWVCALPALFAVVVHTISVISSR